MRDKIIMVYPKMGFTGVFVKHIPLSLLYASIEIVKANIKVQIFDARLYPNSWEKELKKILTPDVRIVGISVMTGQPIKNAIKIGRFVKKIDAEIKVVWGGPHCTFYPETCFQEWSCDYVVSGYGSKPFYWLIKSIGDNKEPENIKGVYYRKDDQIEGTPYETEFEFVDYRDIPYHLIKDYKVYGQFDDYKIVFSIYSAMGCPYKCAFCSSPAHYKNFKKQWIPLKVNQVVDHVEHVVNKYSATYIYFIDDDSFVNLKYVENIIDEINRRKIKVKLGFRGARINEIKKMSDEFIDKLAGSGTDMIHVGAESGSNRILKLVRKNCTVEDIIECNLKLKKHPGIRVGYNFIMGLPTESMGEVKKTRDLMLRLVKDNPDCIIFPPNKYRPLPKTELFELVVTKWNYASPENLTDWINIEVDGDFTNSWHPNGFDRLYNLILLSSNFIDDKVFKITLGESLLYKLLRIASKIYKPIIIFRLKHNITSFFVEWHLYKILVIFVLRLKQR